jgi:hypothetical protein
MATKKPNPFAKYREGKESKAHEKGESKGLQRYEAKKGMERHGKKAGRKC